MLAPALTVAENLALDADAPVGLDLMRSWIRFSARKAAAPSLELARKLGWNLNPDAIVSNLSVGQQQRIEIVKALATNARIIIFDEPTAVLNGDEIEDLFGVLRRLRGENKSIVLIAHKLSEIMAVADRVTVLRKGHLVSTQSIKDTSSAELAVMMVGNVSEINQMQTEDVPVLTSGIDANSELVCKASGLTILGERGEVAISGLDLEVYAGEIFGIGGVDGNGQAELAEVLAGLRRPDSGTLDVRSPRTGYIPQDRRRSGLALSMSVSDNLLFEAAQQAEFRHGPILRSGSLRALASSMIREYDIRTPGPKVPASILSGGNQQKIVVARALRSKPAWVVAMNPTRGLDIGAARFVHNQLRKARDRGAAVLVISTDLDELAALADRSAILAGGVLSPYNSCDVSAADIGLLLGGVTTAHAESRAAMQ
jgi:simple sugar transport system ATP-binding protein